MSISTQALCREKAIKARIQELEQRQQRLAAAAGGGDADAGEGFAGFGGAGTSTAGDAEEVERELWLLQADMAALQVRRRALGQAANGGVAGEG